MQGQDFRTEAWDLSRIDEMWQIEQWGEDEEATEVLEIKANSSVMQGDSAMSG